VTRNVPDKRGRVREEGFKEKFHGMVVQERMENLERGWEGERKREHGDVESG
jgi:hypothetical protein